MPTPICDRCRKVILPPERPALVLVRDRGWDQRYKVCAECLDRAIEALNHAPELAHAGPA